jgi:hypothetical protein
MLFVPFLYLPNKIVVGNPSTYNVDIVAVWFVLGDIVRVGDLYV